MKLITRNKKELERREAKDFIKQIEKLKKEKLYTYKDVFGEDPK